MSRLHSSIGVGGSAAATGLPGRRLWLAIAAILMLLALLSHRGAEAQADATAAIDAPQPDEVLAGAVLIRGTADSPSFGAAELDFSYAGDEPKMWFALHGIDHPISNAELATWDTTAISDGDYVLRLRVTSLDGSSVEATVNVQVRNYTSPAARTPTATPTKAPSVQIPAPQEVVASATSAPIVPASPTALPPNPAAVSESSVYGTFLRGALLVAVVVLTLGLVFLRRQV